MKSFYTYALIGASLLLYARPANAQIVQVRDGDGNVLNGTMVQITQPIGEDAQVLEESAAVENISGTARTVNVKRYEVDVPHGTGNYFCWDLCYGERNAGLSPLWVSSDPVAMDAGEIANGFHAYYKPHGTVGEATFRYVWYDVNSPNDSVWVDFKFNAMTVGISENNGPVRAFNAFPNPSVGGDIALNYDLTDAGAGMQVAVYNMLGERQLVRPLSASQGKVVLRAGELPAGVWFASLERNGTTLVTKRVVVTH